MLASSLTEFFTSSFAVVGVGSLIAIAILIYGLVLVYRAVVALEGIHNELRKTGRTIRTRE